MNSDEYNSKQAIPNKLLQEDGTITDLMGTEVVNATEVYKSKRALPNKFLNPDGTYSTLEEILGGSIGADIFEVVDELPETGEPNKIYLVPNGTGGFNEYHYVNGAWDSLGMIEFDLTNYYTKSETDSNFLKKTNTTAYTPTENYHPATKKYVDDAITTNITNMIGGAY